MILSDKKIKEEVELGNITISEFDKARINPASYDVLLGDEIAMYLPRTLNFGTYSSLLMGKQESFLNFDTLTDIVGRYTTNREENWQDEFFDQFEKNDVREFLYQMMNIGFDLFYHCIHTFQEYIVIDPLDKTTMEVYKFEIPETGFIVQPGYFYLYSIKETVGSNLYASEIKNKSSVARFSLLIHFVASWIDVGFVGNVTLEVASWLKVILRPNMKIGQLIFHEVTEVKETYDKKAGSKYMNQSGVQESKYYLNKNAD